MTRQVPSVHRFLSFAGTRDPTLIGSIRRECLDHVMIFNEQGLRRILQSYFEYYEKSRTHLGLGKDAPIHRSVQPPALEKVIELPQVGGLHHRYERRAAKR